MSDRVERGRASPVTPDHLDLDDPVPAGNGAGDPLRLGDVSRRAGISVFGTPCAVESTVGCAAPFETADFLPNRRLLCLGGRVKIEHCGDIGETATSSPASLSSSPTGSPATIPVVSCQVDIHVLTGSGRLSAHAARIRSQVRAAAGASLAQLPLEGEVDLVVRDDPRRVIPEVGIGGFAPDGHTVFVALDPDHEKFEWALERELFPTLAHELHHVARHQASMLGHTLFEALVNEGLADHFSIEATGVEPPPWAVALTADQTGTMVARAREEYDYPRYNHSAWFFGSDELGIPRWTGYSLGFQLVGEYLDRHPGSKASALATARSATLRPSS